MADYDAKIRVGTDVDTKRIREAEREVDRLAKKLDNVRQRSAKLEALGGTARQFESLGYDAEMLENQLADATESLEQLRTEGFDKAEKSAKKCFDTVDKGAKKSNKSFGSTMKVLKNMVLSMIVFRVIAKGTEYIAEGFNNLVQYSSELNGVFSDLKSETATLKNSMATAFAPIVAQIVPYLTTLVSWLNTAMNAITQFWAVLSGKNTYTRAKKQMVDYAKSLKNASKEAKGALASFDQLNVLNKNSASGTNGELNGADAFEEVKVDKGKFLWVDKLREALDKISEAATPVIGKIKDGLAWLYEKVLVPLGEWAMETALPVVVEYIAKVFEILGEIIEEFEPVFEWLWKNFIEPIGKWKGDTIIWAIETMTELINDLWYDALVPFIKWFKENVLPVILPILEKIAEAVQEMLDYVDDILEGFKHGLEGVIEFIGGVFSGDWEKAWDGLTKIVEGVWESIKGVINFILSGIEGLVNGVIGGINAIIDALSISIDVPKWAQGQIGTDKIVLTDMPHIEEIALPRLATGGIVTSSTLANIGEAGREAVLPLENNTDWMDVLAEKVTGKSGTIDLTINLDGNVVYKRMVQLDREHANRTGSSQFAY